MTRQELREMFGERFGKEPTLEIVSPGRTELAGNHTDHEGGHVIAAAVDRAVHGMVAPNEEGRIRLVSLGFNELELPLDDLAARESEHGATSALVRGMAAQFAERGLVSSGFDMLMYSDVLGGSGLSSSAAFELAIGQTMNALWAKGKLTAEELALMSQRSEHEWFGKPCGLMDQAAVALGGIQHLDFSDPAHMLPERLDFDFSDHGYAICIISVGEDHAANIDDYAAMPGEMQAVARELGENVLSKVTLSQVVAEMPRLREQLGDRALLRAVHYYREEDLVTRRVQALHAGDVEEFCRLTSQSGASSAMYLQNVSVGGSSNQPSMLAIALAESLLEGRGAARVHGGGFGGTIQAFVPLEMTERFSQGMDAVFGEGACGVYGIDQEGARAQWL